METQQRVCFQLNRTKSRVDRNVFFLLFPPRIVDITQRQENSMDFTNLWMILISVSTFAFFRLLSFERFHSLALRPSTDIFLSTRN